MYETFYNLKAEPFRLSPDHRFCFSHQSYAKAKAYMQYAYQRSEGFVMITGRPGTGKSTLVNDLVASISDGNVQIAKLVCTQLEGNDLLRMVAHAYKIKSVGVEKSTLIQQLGKTFSANHKDGRRTLLIIDEAQDLSASALEELRLLTNLQISNQPLLQIFLLGQEELRGIIQEPGMEQVHQRIVAACHLQPLKNDETRSYIRHRLNQAGWQGVPALSEAIYPVVYKFSEGIPRRINLICSRLFLHGCVEELERLGIKDLREVVTELQEEHLCPSDLLTDADFLDEDIYPREARSSPAGHVSSAGEGVTPLRRDRSATGGSGATAKGFEGTSPAKTRGDQKLQLAPKAGVQPPGAAPHTKANFEAREVTGHSTNRMGIGDRRRWNRRINADRREAFRFEPETENRRKNDGRRKEDQKVDPWNKSKS